MSVPGVTMVISVICYVMIRGITNGIVTSVICYAMLRGITGHYGYVCYMLCNIKRNYWSLWVPLLYVMKECLFEIKMKNNKNDTLLEQF
jgi:hypothetical protein